MFSTNDAEHIMTPYQIFHEMHNRLNDRKYRGVLVDYDRDESALVITHEKFRHGLLINLDAFGVWVIREVESDIKGNIKMGQDSRVTENTDTIFRAIDNLLLNYQQGLKTAL
jgi:hypothetical protein